MHLPSLPPSLLLPRPQKGSEVGDGGLEIRGRVMPNLVHLQGGRVGGKEGGREGWRGGDGMGR